MERLFTIGAYGFDAERFFETLEDVEIDLFLDLRRRRGVRGSAYAFANATRLQHELGDRGIAYRHLLELAPQPATRALQNLRDAADHVAKRQREVLDEAFVEDYIHRTLDPFQWKPLIEELEPVQRPVLFCVERLPQACHRHLAAQRLAEQTGTPVTDLLP
jgi:uncharacterized protein (DUF488 family)